MTTESINAHYPDIVQRRFVRRLSGSVVRVKSIGENVRLRRQQEGLSQTDLAEKLGGEWVQKTVSRVENGQDITVSQLERLMQVLGPQILAETSLGAVTSRDFAYLYNEVRLEGVRGRADQSLRALDHAAENLKIMLELLDGPR